MSLQSAEYYLQTTLEEFINSDDKQLLGIGEIQDVILIKQFKRPYSVQAVYQLVGQHGERTVYVKWFKNWRNKPVKQFKQEVAIEFQTMRFWYEQLAEFDDVTTFRPLFYSQKNDCIITEAMEGQNLAVLIQQKAKGKVSTTTLAELNKYLHRSGVLLRRFQQKVQQESIYDYHQLVEDVDIRLKQLVNIPRSGFSETDRKRVLAFYEQHINRGDLPPFQQVVLHRDFGLGNILVNDHQVIVHDFNRMEYGHPYFDFSRLYHQLIMLGYKPIYFPGTIRQMLQAYCQGYGVPSIAKTVVFQMFLLRHFFTHLLGLVKSRETSWASRLYSQWVKFRHLAYIRRLSRI